MRRLSLTLVIIMTVFTGVANDKATPAVVSMVERLSPESSNRFTFEIFDPQSNVDFFEVSVARNKILIKGNSQISLARGVDFYLKKYQNISLSINNYSFKLPKRLERLEVDRHETALLIRSTFDRESFAGLSAYWGWKEWQRAIDILALSGINMAYVPIATELVWRDILVRLNIDPKSFIPLPTYQSLWLDGVYLGGGEELPDSWYLRQYLLHKNIFSEFESWGIIPIVEGYNGVVPGSYKELNQEEKWHDGILTPSVLDDSGDDYKEISKLYYSVLRGLFGDFRYFNINPDNVKNPNNILSNLQDANPNAIWVYQKKSGKSEENINLLANETLLVIGDTDSFHNRLSINSISEESEPYKKRTYKGVFIDDIFNDNYDKERLTSSIWGDDLSLSEYVEERYGEDSLVNDIMILSGLVNRRDNHAFYKEPSLKADYYSQEVRMSYLNSLKNLVRGSYKHVNNKNYQHDVIIYTAEAVYQEADYILSKIDKYIDDKDLVSFKNECEEFLNLMYMLDAMFATNDMFSFYNDIDIVKSKGDNALESKIYEKDIRTYSTIWGSRYSANMHNMNDVNFSMKSGILDGYYKSRWAMFFSSMEDVIKEKYNLSIDYYDMGDHWSDRQQILIHSAKGSPILKSVDIINALSESK